MSLEHPPGGAGVLDLSKLEGVPTQNHPQGNSTAISNPLASLSEAAKQQHIRQLVQLYIAHQQLLHQQVNTGPPENPAVDAADPNDAKSA